MTTADLEKEVSHWCKLRLQFASMDETAKRGLDLVQEYVIQKAHGILATRLEAARAAVTSFFEQYVARPFLLPHHQALLEQSAINPEVAAARGYRSVIHKSDLRVLGFGQNQWNIPGLLIPIFAPTGEIRTHQLRPDSPRTDKGGKVVKYESPLQGQLTLDVNPFIPRDSLRAPAVPLFITEGSRKADAAVSQGLCCLSIPGVSSFRGTNEFGGKTAFAEWEQIALNDRLVYLVFDSDVMEKRSVYGALRRLSAFLIDRKAVVRYVYLPSGENGTKTGLDDFLAAGRTRDEVVRLASDRMLAPVGDDTSTEHNTFPYLVKGGQILFQSRRVTTSGEELYDSRPVADFTAFIEEQITSESGATTYKIAGTGKRGGEWHAEISAEQFADERTLCACLGSSAGAFDGIYAGMKKHVGPALNKLTNGNLRHTKRFERTGWTDDTFLIPGREPEGVTVALKPKLPYRLAPASLDKGLTALQALLESGGGAMVGPIVAYLLGAPLARVAGWGERYCLFVVGRSGTLKTSTMQTALCLYGPDFIKDEYLLRWGQGATPNALMQMATYCTDLPFLIDNYKPGTTRDPNDFVKLIHVMIEGGEKDRLKKDSELKDSRPNHSWPACTGEDCPDSDPATLARCLVVEFPNFRRQVNHPLAQAQELSAHLCAVGAAWIDWLESETGRETAQRYGKHLNERRGLWVEYLNKLRMDMVNPLRAAGNLAMNELAWKIAEEHPDLSPVLRPFREQYRTGLAACAKHLASATAEALEGQRFLAALRQLIATERVELLPIGEAPKTETDRTRLVGWRDTDGSVFLSPDIALKHIYDVLGRTGLGSISLGTLYNQLDSLGALQSHDPERKSKVKRVAPDTLGRFMHLTASAVQGEEEFPSQEMLPVDG